MNLARKIFFIPSTLLILILSTVALGQSVEKAHASPPQSVITALGTLPEADTVIYTNPKRILIEAAPKVMQPANVQQMRAEFSEWKKNVGIDPSTLDYLAIAVRFQKPSSDLSFVPPDLLAVFGGDFNADSLLSLAGTFLQENARTEQYKSKTITIIKVDPIAEAAQENPFLR